MRIMRRRVPILVVAGAIALAVTPSLAQTWPQKPVRIIYPYSAGSTGDAAARLLAQRFSQAFGQPFIVENRLGANGALATDAVARAPADGHTLLWAITPQIAINPAMTKVSYHPVNDFAPISAVSGFAFALVVNPRMPVRTTAEFVDYIRAQPKELAYAEGGVGSISHLSMVLLLDRVGLKMTNVSYRGNEPALTDVIAGHLPTMFAVLGDALSHVASGSIRMLAVSTEQRSPQAPQVPTIGESGFPGFKTGSWHGLMAPAGTPRPIVDRIATEVQRATKDPKYVERLANYGIDPLGSSPKEFATMIAADIKFWAEAVRIAGVKLQ